MCDTWRVLRNPFWPRTYIWKDVNGKHISRIPRAYSEAHENPYFQASSGAKSQKVVLELKNSIFKKLFEMHVGGQNGFLSTLQVSHIGLEPIYGW